MAVNKQPMPEVFCRQFRRAIWREKLMRDYLALTERGVSGKMASASLGVDQKYFSGVRSWLCRWQTAGFAGLFLDRDLNKLGVTKSELHLWY